MYHSLAPLAALVGNTRLRIILLAAEQLLLFVASTVGLGILQKKIATRLEPSINLISTFYKTVGIVLCDQ